VTGELLPALRDAFDAALRGTRNDIHVTAEGLFAAGAPGDALTWMDARVDGAAVTPRAGCPVELTALWAAACDTLARLARAGAAPPGARPPPRRPRPPPALRPPLRAPRPRPPHRPRPPPPRGGGPLPPPPPPPHPPPPPPRPPPPLPRPPGRPPPRPRPP